MRDDARKDDRQQPTPSPSPQYKSVDLVTAASSLVQQTPLVDRAIEAYERAKDLPPGALSLKISL